MDHEKRQYKDIMSLENEKWPLWSKKEGKKTREIRHGERFNYMEIWNSKSGGNMHSEFDDKFGILPEIWFRHTIYCFESQEVKSSTLQRVYKLELKWRSYGHLKTTMQSWRAISKFNLWIWNPIQNDPSFEFTYFHFDVSPPLSRELHPGHFVCLKWAPYDKKSPFYYFQSFLDNYFCNKWTMRVCHMLGYWWYYIKSLSSRFEEFWIFFQRVWHWRWKKTRTLVCFLFLLY